MRDKNEIKVLFDKKILGIRNYKSDKREFNTTDFLDFKVLVDYLWELDTGECDITPAGKSFIENYYGFDELAKKLATHGYDLPPENTVTNQQTFTAWLKSLVPMETITFIEQARGNIGESTKLRDDLLPPEL